MITNPAELCAFLLKEKRIRLEKTSFQNTFSKQNSFSTDESGCVTGLNLSGQALKDISFIHNLTSLCYLNLSRNMISDITPLGGLTNLTHLDIFQNFVRDIRSLGALKKLSWANLGKNKISQFPPDIASWNIKIAINGDSKHGMILNDNPVDPSAIQRVNNERQKKRTLREKKMKKKG